MTSQADRRRARTAEQWSEAELRRSILRPQGANWSFPALHEKDQTPNALEGACGRLFQHFWLTLLAWTDAFGRVAKRYNERSELHFPCAFSPVCDSAGYSRQAHGSSVMPRHSSFRPEGTADRYRWSQGGAILPQRLCFPYRADNKTCIDAVSFPN